MTAIVIGLRHGEVHNPDHVIYAGLPGFGLSERGREQARAMAEDLAQLDVVAVYASPLDRAVETAGFVAASTGAEVVTDDRLQEWKHWYQWAGLTWEQLQERAADAWEAYTTDPGSVTSGESLAELGDRMQSWLRDALERHDRGVVVVVSHLEPLRAILMRLLDRPAADLFALRVELCEAVRIHPDPSADTALPSALVRATS